MISLRHRLPECTEQRGSSMIEFLIVLPMLVFLAFYPISTYIFQVQRNHLEHVKDRYLQEAQLEGGFTVELWDRLLADLEARNFDLSRVDFSGSTPVGEIKHRGQPIVLRIGYPQGNARALLSLLSLQRPDPNRMMWVSGSILSERP